MGLKRLNRQWTTWHRRLFWGWWRLCALGCLIGGVQAGEASWPQFRGPNGSGVGEGSFPVHFGPETNLAWSVAAPSGSASPCVYGNRLFLVGREENRLVTVCLDRTTGKVLWTSELSPDRIQQRSGASNPDASTPCTDGQRLYVYFGSFGLVAYDFDGRELWQKPLPTPVTQHGTGSSPVVVDGKLILVCDQDAESYLLAVDTRTGQTVWRTPRPDARRGFSTPLLWPPAAPSVVVVAGTLRLVAYRIDGGREEWSVEGLPNEMVASPTSDGETIYVAGWTPGAGVSQMPSFDDLLTQADQDHDSRLSQAEAPPGPAKHHFQYIDANRDGFIDRGEYEGMASIFQRSQNAMLAVQPGVSGKESAPIVRWKQTRGLPYVPSPLCHQGRVWVVKNGGLISCYDARTGRSLFQEERLDSLGDYYASPVAAGDRVCVISQPGTAVVLRSGDSLEIIARNTLGEPVLATPAIAGGCLYIRTQRRMMAFREE